MSAACRKLIDSRLDLARYRRLGESIEVREFIEPQSGRTSAPLPGFNMDFGPALTASLALLLAKDSNVTGGTTQQ